LFLSFPLIVAHSQSHARALNASSRGRCHCWFIAIASAGAIPVFVAIASAGAIPVFVAIASAIVVIARGFVDNARNLGCGIIGVQNAQTVWVQITVPVDHKDKMTIAYGPAGFHHFAID
jgi:hypothetical protein